MNVRRATLADYAEVMALYGDFMMEDRFSGHDNDSYKQFIGGPGKYLFLAEVDGKIIGFASLAVRRVIRYPKPIADLEEFYVDAAHRHQAAGRQLMQQVEATTREEGCWRLYVQSSYKHTQGHKFYEAAGFTNRGYYFLKEM